MTYPLDVNALIASGLCEHTFHQLVIDWLDQLPDGDEIAVTPITELGFVRILSQIRDYGISVDKARELLQDVKSSRHERWIFIPDDHDTEHLPKWVVNSRQTTDGHLAELARAHGAILATLDKGIPGALLIGLA